MMLIAMVVMFGAAPMMTGVTEDKSQRIVEMLLGIATPLDLMAGKVMAGVARSLTSSLLYVTGATVVLLGMNVVGIAPLTLLPWFYAYLLAEVTLLCALAAGLGAACNTPQEAGNLVMVVMAPHHDPDVHDRAGGEQAERRVCNGDIAVSSVHASADDVAADLAGRRAGMAACGPGWLEPLYSPCWESGWRREFSAWRS